jgi:hypothetical protein
MYYHDLSPCSYFSPELADKLVAVGWLEHEQAYTRGRVSEQFLDRLFELLVKPWNPVFLMGYAECSFCDLASYRLDYNAKTIIVGNLNLYVPGEGFLYVMPSLAVHYILAHGYAPPQEFCEAVLRCPPMRSSEYFQAIAANAPPRYSDIARKHLTGST